LGARSFADFWRLWNPVYGYVLLFFVYRPLRQRLPRPAAVYLTFLVSGFLLHDLPFSLSGDLARGQVAFPAVTLLFAVFGALALLSEALRLDLARYPWWLRAASNLAWLAIAFGVRALVLVALAA
jgi:hypothetical protein